VQGRRLLLSLLLFLGLAFPAWAQVTISFYSRDFGETFPHAFFTLRGTVAGDTTPVDANYGFTAVTVSPAILMGPVKGKVETVKPDFVRKSQLHLSFPISDDQYRAVVALVDRWRSLPGRSYDLNKRNCVFFVAAVARTLGLDVVEDRKLMKKPRSFLDDVVRRNQRVAASGPAMAR